MERISTKLSIMRLSLDLRVCENVTSTTSVYSHTSSALVNTFKSMRS